MDDLFHILPDTFVIIRTRRGIFRQCKVYIRGKNVYAGVGQGYIRLLANNGTTCPDYLWERAMEMPGVSAPFGTPVYGLSSQEEKKMLEGKSNA